MMEQTPYSSSSSSGPSCSSLLGFFMQPISGVYGEAHKFRFEGGQISYSRYRPRPKPVKFVYTCDEGKDLAEGKWGDMDATLSYLELQQQDTVRIVASSNGFLLCCTGLFENMQYIICNPVTREFKLLPEPHKNYKAVALAFICRAGDVGMWYEVVRAGIGYDNDGRVALSTSLELETYSSRTGEWRESCLVAASPLALDMAHSPATVIDGVMYWRDLNRRIVVFDPRLGNSIRVLAFPAWTDHNSVTVCDHLGSCEGKIHYARHNGIKLETWVLLEDYSWVIRYRLCFCRLIQENPHVIAQQVINWTGIHEIHPWNSRIILLSILAKPYWCNLETCKLEEIGGYQLEHFAAYNYFRYQWPCNPTIH